MVLAIRRGSSLRRVARRFHVSHTTVRRWAVRLQGQRLDRADWQDRPAGPPVAANRTPVRVERTILAIRRRLQQDSPLGEHGAAAIHRELLQRQLSHVPCVRTIGRILGRHGILDGRHRVRRPAPPRGWYLPPVAAQQAELDSFDTITDLVIQGGQDVTVLTGISLHGALAASWPAGKITAQTVVEKLLEHWAAFGCPAYVQFDNDTIFQGAHQWADSFGRVTRCCLQLGVTPVFVPPREPGFQAHIEAFHGRWQRAVWRRFHHRHLRDLCRRNGDFLEALRQHLAPRVAAAPPRPALPHNFVPDYQRPLAGQVIFLRRTDGQGRTECLGHRWLVDPLWPHRLVRLEVDLTTSRIRIYKLRRREPDWQPLVKTVRYRVPRTRFLE